MRLELNCDEHYLLQNLKPFYQPCIEEQMRTDGKEPACHKRDGLSAFVGRSYFHKDNL